MIKLVAGWCLCGILAVAGASAAGQSNTMHAEPMQGAPAATAPAITANPAMWRVEGPHETVYLFGTVHVLKPGVNWETPAFKSAFAKSDTVYLEITGLEDTKALQPMVMQLGIDEQHPLSSKISAQDKAELDKALQAMGMPGEQMLEPMQPWLAYMTLSLLPVVKAGYSPTGGVDLKISQLATEQHKPVLGFETALQQIHYLADLPQAQQVTLLQDELAELPNALRQMDDVSADWEKGDVEGIAKLDDAATRKTPALYKLLVADRNQRFADKIAGLLASDKPGTVFVAIGAAHLAGPDSVQKDLVAKGYKVTRVE